MAERPGAPTAPERVLETDPGATVMSPGHDYHVGRDPLSDIVIDDARVSWHHAVLRPESDHWTLADEKSTNGTNADGRRAREPRRASGAAAAGRRRASHLPPRPPPPPCLPLRGPAGTPRPRAAFRRL